MIKSRIRSPKTSIDVPVEYPAGGPFFKLLLWHLRRNGTRPTGLHKEWRGNEFAGVVFESRSEDALASDARKVSHWLRGENHPKVEEFDRILEALFGDNQTEIYVTWRNDLDNFLRGGRESGKDNTTAGLIRASLRWRPKPVTGFVGRYDLLKTIHETLSSETGRIALHGVPGVGKSSIALEYANQYSQHYAGVWLCPAEIGLQFSLAKLAVILGVADAETSDVETAAFDALDALERTETPWLLIYDNAVDPRAIRPYLPPPNTKLLVTSRFPNWYDGISGTRVDTLPATEAAALLNTLANKNDDAGAAILAEVLGWLPLALNQAGATCQLFDLDFLEYAARVEKLLDEGQPSTDYPNSVFATFTIAIDSAAAQCRAAEDLIAYLAQCSPEPIPSTLAHGAIANEQELYRAQTLLMSLSLIQQSPFEDGTSALIVHRLVQSVARVRSEAKGTAEQSVARLMNKLEQQFPKDPTYQPSLWPRCERLVPHIMVLRDRHPDSFIDVYGIQILILASDYLRARYAIDLAKSCLESALEFSAILYGADDETVGLVLQGLVDIYFEQGDLAAAHKAALRAVSILEKQHGRSSTETARSLGSLAKITLFQDHVGEAEQLYRKAIDYLELKSSPDQVSLDELRVGLALCLLHSGREAEGIQLLERSVEFSESSYGADDLRTAVALLRLGSMLSLDNNTRDLVRSLLERALQICEAKFGDGGVTADALIALGQLENDLGNSTVASRLFERAIEIQKRGVAADNHRRALTAHLLAVSNFDGIDWSIRQRTLEDLLAVRTRVYGEKHVVTMLSTLDLGLQHYVQRNFALARPLLRSTAIFWEADPTREPIYIRNLVVLGILEYRTGNLTAAKIIFNKILEQHRGNADSEVAKTIFFLSEIAWQEHNIEAALDGYERSLSMLRIHSTPGCADGMPAGVNCLPEDQGGDPNDVFRRQSFHELGYHLFRCADDDAGMAYEQALQFDPERLGPDDFGLPPEIIQGAATFNGTPASKNFREALDSIIREREIKLGGDHPATHAARSILAPILYNLGLPAQAIAVMDDALIAQTRLLGVAHPWTQKAKIRRDQILEAQRPLDARS